MFEWWNDYHWYHQHDLNFEDEILAGNSPFLFRWPVLWRNKSRPISSQSVTPWRSSRTSEFSAKFRPTNFPRNFTHKICLPRFLPLYCTGMWSTTLMPSSSWASRSCLSKRRLSPIVKRKSPEELPSLIKTVTRPDSSTTSFSTWKIQWNFYEFSGNFRDYITRSEICIEKKIRKLKEKKEKIHWKFPRKFWENHLTGLEHRVLKSVPVYHFFSVHDGYKSES